MYPQAPSAVVMIRPHQFISNPQTFVDNVFQAQSSLSAEEVRENAYREVTAAAEKLQEHGIRVHLFEDTGESTPDSVFPNNWFSTHTGGYVGVYPMFPENRRLERRMDILDTLKREYRVQEIVDYSGLENDHIFLEGTGSMVLDHVERIAYATSSNRTSPVALERFCAHFNYEPMLFDALDENGKPIYHTNVIMCIASDFVLICDEFILDSERRKEIIQRLEASGRSVIRLSVAQINEFAGNALELAGKNGRILAMSQRGVNALSEEQVSLLKKRVTILPFDVPTIELAGGSIRCMLAGVHLSPR